MKQHRGNLIIWFLITGDTAAFFLFRSNDNDSHYNSSDSPIFRSVDYYEDEEAETIDRYDAIDEYWDELKDYVNGTRTIDACSYESGNCYSSDALISNGKVEIIYFPNGGHLYFSADIDESGNASDTDEEGNWWYFKIDADSSSIDDAIENLASDTAI